MKEHKTQSSTSSQNFIFRNQLVIFLCVLVSCLFYFLGFRLGTPYKLRTRLCFNLRFVSILYMTSLLPIDYTSRLSFTKLVLFLELLFQVLACTSTTAQNLVEIKAGISRGKLLKVQRILANGFLDDEALLYCTPKQKSNLFFVCSVYANEIFQRVT